MKTRSTRNVKPSSKLDRIFAEYDASHQNSANIFIHWVCVPLTTFGIFGLIWSIPFPYLEFLDKYNGFVNWASFLIAISIYFYLKLSPTLSYGMLFFVGLFSYFIVQLEYWEIARGPAMWLVCLIILVVSLVGQIIGYNIEGKKLSFTRAIRFLPISPIWLLAKLYKKLKIPY